MEKITHEFKAGDWVDCSELSEDQKTTLCFHLCGGSSDVRSISDTYATPIIYCESESRLILLAPFAAQINDENKKLTWQQLTAPLEQKPFTHDMIRDWLDGTEFTGAINARMSELQEAVSKFDMDEFEAMDRLENKMEEKTVDYDEWSDENHLSWLYRRMADVYGENKNVDYMLRFKEIIDGMNKKPKGGFASRSVTISLNKPALISDMGSGNVSVGYVVEQNFDDALSNVKQEICEEAMKKVPVGYQEDQPYTPQVGEECEVIFADDTVPEWLKTIFIGALEGKLIHKFNGKIEESESFEFKFRPLKTERDILMDAIKEGLHPSVYEAQKEYYGYAVDKLIRLGLIK